MMNEYAQLNDHNTMWGVWLWLRQKLCSGSVEGLELVFVVGQHPVLNCPGALEFEVCLIHYAFAVSFGMVFLSFLCFFNCVVLSCFTDCCFLGDSSFSSKRHNNSMHLAIRSINIQDLVFVRTFFFWQWFVIGKTRKIDGIFTPISW